MPKPPAAKSKKKGGKKKGKKKADDETSQRSDSPELDLRQGDKHFVGKSSSETPEMLRSATHVPVRSLPADEAELLLSCVRRRQAGTSAPEALQTHLVTAYGTPETMRETLYSLLAYCAKTIADAGALAKECTDVLVALKESGWRDEDLAVTVEEEAPPVESPDDFMPVEDPHAPSFLRSTERVRNTHIAVEAASKFFQRILDKKDKDDQKRTERQSMSSFFHADLAEKFKDPKQLTEWAYNLVFVCLTNKGKEEDTITGGYLQKFFDKLAYSVGMEATTGESRHAMEFGLRALNIVTAETVARQLAEAAEEAEEVTEEAPPPSIPVEMVLQLTKESERGNLKGVQDTFTAMQEFVKGAFGADGAAAEQGMALLKAAVNAHDETSGLTPLHMAARKGHHEVVTFLVIKAFAEPNIGAFNGWTPLHIAAFHGAAKAVQALLGASADPNATDLDGMTPMHIAATRSAETVAIFLNPNFEWSKKVEINCMAAGGWTPLTMAAHAGKADVVKVLITAKADLHLPTLYNKTALDYAVRHEDVKRILSVAIVAEERERQRSVGAEAEAAQASVLAVDELAELGLTAANVFSPGSPHGQTRFSLSNSLARPKKKKRNLDDDDDIPTGEEGGKRHSSINVPTGLTDTYRSDLNQTYGHDD